MWPEGMCFQSRLSAYRGGGGNLCREKIRWAKLFPKIRDPIFPAFLRIGTEFCPAILRIVEFYLNKDSNYRQNTIKNFPALRAGVYFFPLPAGRDRIFPGQNKDWDRNFPGRIFRQAVPPPPGILSHRKKNVNTA